MKVAAIFFDVGGVLIGSHFETFLTIVAGKLGVEAEYLIRIRKIYHKDMVTGRFSVEEFLRTLKHEKGMTLEDSEMLDIWKSNYIKVMGINDDIYSFISTLDCRVGIISDVYALHAKMNRARGVYDGFDPCILSCEVQLSKTGSEIFNLALKECGLSAKECVFIDDREKNVRVAQELGFKAILFEGNKKLIADLSALGVHHG